MIIKLIYFINIYMFSIIKNYRYTDELWSIRNITFEKALQNRHYHMFVLFCFALETLSMLNNNSTVCILPHLILSIISHPV